MTDEPRCNAEAPSHGYTCSRELGHGTVSRPGMVRNKFERNHISKNEDGVVQMIWEET